MPVAFTIPPVSTLILCFTRIGTIVVSDVLYLFFKGKTVRRNRFLIPPNHISE